MKIINLNNINDNDIKLVGGKARGLFFLNTLGLCVPFGVVVVDINTKDDIEDIYKYYQENFNNAKVAIRSSATLEDGEIFSSAGQYSTFLNIDNKSDFVDAINDCLLSANDERIKKYREFFAQEDSKMSIVIQKMVDAKVAGVAFSINPINRNNEVLIEAVEGLGEDLVSGLKVSNSYIISKDEPKISEDSLLTKEQIEELHKTTLAIENAMNTPIDIEWAIDKNNVLYLLQCRAITTLNDPTIDELNTKYEVDEDVITNHNVGEMLPEAITPLTISTVVYAIDLGLRRMLKKIGLFKRLKDIPEELLISHYYGHLFFNMKYLYRLSSCILGASKDGVDIAICGRVLDIKQNDNYKGKLKIVRLWNTFRYLGYLLSNKRARKHSYKLARKIDFDYENINTLYLSISQNIKYLNDILSDHYVTSSYSGTMVSAVYQFLLRDNTEEIAKAKLGSVLENIDGIESVDILASIKKISDSVLSDNVDVKKLSDDELLEYLNSDKNEQAKNLYNLFLSKHGHRTIKESELRIPGWKDDQKALVSHIKTLAGTNISPTNNNAKENIKSVLSSYKGLKRRILSMLINNARKGCVSREYSKSQMIVAVDKFKVAYRNLSMMLVQASALSDADMIYFLTHKELGELINNKDAKYIKIAGVRRRLLVEQMSLKFDHVYRGVPKPIKVEDLVAGEGDNFFGSPLSLGHVRGIARVVLNQEDAKKLQKDEIMVSSYTDIGWSPYYSIIKALVTEVGSALSHGAVVAREYGLPIISNVNNITAIIKTGDEIDVNANDGVVTILKKQK